MNSRASSLTTQKKKEHQPRQLTSTTPPKLWRTTNELCIPAFSSYSRAYLRLLFLTPEQQSSIKPLLSFTDSNQRIQVQKI